MLILISIAAAAYLVYWCLVVRHDHVLTMSAADHARAAARRAEKRTVLDDVWDSGARW